VIDRKPVIGIAGGIGSGKSEVARLLGTLGCAVIDADALSREAFNRPEIQHAMISAWGERVVGDDGSVSRSRVAKLVFGDEGERRRLEQMIHPWIATQRAALRSEAMLDPAVVAVVEDAPLLFEVGIDKTCDATIFVDASQAVREARVKSSRGWSPEELAAREKSQLPLDKKRKRADYVIENNVDRASCLEQLHDVLSRIQQSQS